MICIAGKNNIAVNAAQYILEHVHSVNLCVLVNSTDTGEDTWQRSLRKFACTRNISIKQLHELYEVEDLLFISLEYEKIIKPYRFRTSNLYNIHFSNLPKYKGMYTSVWPLLNGETQGGVTLHMIDEGIDTGDIVDQVLFEIDIHETARSLYQKYLDNAFILFTQNIENLIRGVHPRKPQTNRESTYYSKSSLSFKNINIDFNKTAFQIHNQIRAFIFPEYQLPTVCGRKVIRSELTTRKNIIFKDASQKHFDIQGIDGYIVTLTFLD